MSEATTITAPAATPNLNKALSALQGALPKVTKTSEGKIEGQSKATGKPYSYTYKYADLADVFAAVGPLLAKHGLAFCSAPMRDPADRRDMILRWSLLHESGEERSGDWYLGPANTPPQTLGSAITYARRYCLSAATGIVAEDDDDGQRAQRDHGSRQSAGDAWDTAAPAPPRQDGSNGQQRGQAPGPPQSEPAAAADSKAVDADAQKFADEAHKAAGPREMEDIHRRAREAKKVAASIRNPGTGRIGQLALYLDWRRKQVCAACQLSPDDPWALKVEELVAGDTAAATAVLDEMARMLVAGEIDDEHASRVENAIIARFPDAGREELADAS